jgi:hypothetical protein
VLRFAPGEFLAAEPVQPSQARGTAAMDHDPYLLGRG